MCWPRSGVGQPSTYTVQAALASLWSVFLLSFHGGPSSVAQAGGDIDSVYAHSLMRAFGMAFVPATSPLDSRPFGCAHWVASGRAVGSSSGCDRGAVKWEQVGRESSCPRPAQRQPRVSGLWLTSKQGQSGRNGYLRASYGLLFTHDFSHFRAQFRGLEKLRMSCYC